jgi:hypothetical protein
MHLRDDGWPGGGGDVAEEDRMVDGLGLGGGSSRSFYQHKWAGWVDGAEVPGRHVGAIASARCILLKLEIYCAMLRQGLNQ